MLKKFLGQSSIYMIGRMVGKMSSLVTLPILTRVLSKSDYGMLIIITLLMYVLSALSKFGMQHSAVRFYDEFRLGRRSEGIETYYNTLYWGSFIFAVLTAVLFIVFTHYFPTILGRNMSTNIFFIIAALSVAESMNVRISNFLRIEQRVKSFVLVGLFSNYGRIATGLAFILLIEPTVSMFFFGSLLFSFIALPLLSIMLFGIKKISFKRFSISFLKENMSFGYPLIGFEISSLLMKLSDRFVIQIVIGTMAVGLYSVAGNLAMGVSEGIFTSVWMAISPVFMQIWSEHGEKETKQFLSSVLRLLIFLSLPMVFGLSAISHDIIVVMASDKYAEAASALPFLIAGAVIWGITPVLASGLHIHKKTKKMNYIVMVGTGANIILNIITVPLWGIMGAAVSTLVTYCVVIVLVRRVSFRYLSIPIDFISALHFFIVSVCMYVLLILLPLEPSIMNLLLKVGIGALFYAIAILIINQHIRKYATNAIHSVLKPATGSAL